MKIQGHEVIFKTVTGSQSYGTAVEGSDIDIKGVYIQDPEDVYVNGYKEQLDINKDETYYEIGRYLSLCQTGNPTMLELMYAPEDCIQYISPVFQKVIDNRNLFLTKALRYSFGGYAIEQIKKAGGLQKKMNWEKNKITRKDVQDMCSIYSLEDVNLQYISEGISLKKWLKDNQYDEKYCGLVKLEHFRDCYLLFHDHNQMMSDNPRFADQVLSVRFNGITTSDIANDVCVSEIPKYMKPKALMFFHRDAYSVHCKEYREYTAWMEKRNVQRYVDIESHGQQIDGKNILHCVRLIETALEIPTQKTINIRRPNAEYLIGIRKGKQDLKTLLEKCEADLQTMDKVFIESDLPDKVDKQMVEKLIKDIKKDYYQNNDKQSIN